MPALRPLAEGFSQASEAEWRLLAERSRVGGLGPLRSASFDGLPIGPIYAPASGPVLAMRPPGSPWTIFQRIDQGEADAIRTEIGAALHGGATGIELVFSSSPATHGRGLDPNAAGIELVSGLPATVRLDAGEQTPRLALGFAQIAKTLVAAYDPVATMAAQGGLAHPIDESAAGIAALIDSMDRDSRSGLAFIADGRPWHNGGASEVQELAAVLASAVATLRLLGVQGVGAGPAFRRLGVALSADADQFLTIAKFRAVRLLFARLAEVAGLDAVRPPVHAETARRMLTRREPTMNMVRSTTAASAAATGGADSVSVLSPLFEEEPFNARMARNTQTILIEESSLCRAGDPGAGAGAVEALTGELAAAAWELFTRIEGEGGLVAAVQSGSIQRAVAATRDSRLEKVARRQIPLVGVNVHVDRKAAIPAVEPAPSAIRGSEVTPLRPVRLAEPFERLCARSIDGNGRRRSLLLVRAGRGEDPAASGDAFAAGGFEVISVDYPGPRDSVGEALARSTAQVACVVVGADGSEAAADAASRLRAAGARVVVAAAGSSDGVPAGSFDALLTPDADVVSLLSDVLDRIAQPDENGHS